MMRKKSDILVLAAAAVIAVAPAIATQPMTVKIFRPLNGAKVKGIIRVVAQVSGSLPKFVLFGVDKEWPHSTNVLPYSYDLNTARLSDGPHTLYARAIDAGGSEAVSRGVKVIAVNAPSSPFASVVAVSTKPASQAAPATKQAPGQPPVVLENPVKASEPKAAAAPPEEQAAKAIVPGAVADPTSVKLPAAQPASPQPAAPTVELPSDPAKPHRQVAVAVRRMASGRYLSFREALEKCGGRVWWLHSEKRAEGDVRGRNIQVRIGNREARVNGRMFELDVPARLMENRTFVAPALCSIALPVSEVNYRGDQLEMVIAWDVPSQVALLPMR
jgi:hypothetical protein